MNRAAAAIRRALWRNPHTAGILNRRPPNPHHELQTLRNRETELLTAIHHARNTQTRNK
jgi:hypothetical protein